MPGGRAASPAGQRVRETGCRQWPDQAGWLVERQQPQEASQSSAEQEMRGALFSLSLVAQRKQQHQSHFVLVLHLPTVVTACCKSAAAVARQLCLFYGSLVG